MTKQKIKLTKEIIMDSIPIRNPQLEWFEDSEGELVINVPQRKILNFIPRRKKVIILDKNGKEFWNLCTGEKTIKEIISAIQEKFNLDTITAEHSTMKYFNQLAQRGILGIHIPKDKSKDVFPLKETKETESTENQTKKCDNHK